MGIFFYYLLMYLDFSSDSSLFCYSGLAYPIFKTSLGFGLSFKGAWVRKRMSSDNMTLADSKIIYQINYFYKQNLTLREG